METTWPKLRHRILRPLKTKFDKKKKKDGRKDEWENDGVVNCKVGSKILQFLPLDWEGFLHPSRNNLELEVSAAEYHCCLLLL